MTGNRDDFDAIVIGAGPNGLVAANRLIDAGWSVLVVETQPTVGGAVRSDDDVHPGFTHDTFSAFYPLAAASPIIRSLGLKSYGLVWRHAPAVLGHPLADGDWALLHRDLCLTSALMDLLARLRGAGGLDFARMALTPATRLGATRFGGEAPRILLAGNAGHADIPLDAPGSGFMGLLLVMLGQTVGFPVPEGGAGMLTRALARRLEDVGGHIRCSSEAATISVANRRATGIRTVEGETLTAGRAVIADVAASHLYGRLLDPADLPARVLRRMRSFELDPSTVKVDWALDGPVPWRSPPLYAPGTFHVADSLGQMTQALGQVAAGAIPAEPFLLAGQMSTADPTRSPAGTEALWAYTHVPQRTTGDAGDGGIWGHWDRDDAERFADRMQARIERHAPDLACWILSRRVLGPRRGPRSARDECRACGPGPRPAPSSGSRSLAIAKGTGQSSRAAQADVLLRILP